MRGTRSASSNSSSSNHIRPGVYGFPGPMAMESGSKTVPRPLGLSTQSAIARYRRPDTCW